MEPEDENEKDSTAMESGKDMIPDFSINDWPW